MKNKKIRSITATAAIAAFLAVPALTVAQDVAVPSYKSTTAGGPPAVGGIDAPTESVPFGTGLDLLILLGGGALAKRYRDKKLAK